MLAALSPQLFLGSMKALDTPWKHWILRCSMCWIILVLVLDPKQRRLPKLRHAKWNWELLWRIGFTSLWWQKESEKPTPVFVRYTSWMPGTYAYGKQNDFENHQKLMFRCRLFWSCIDFRLNQFRERWVSAKISLSTFHHHYDICQLLFSHCHWFSNSDSVTEENSVYRSIQLKFRSEMC